MTERGVVYQAGFAGMADDQVAGDVVERCRVMLREEPETRADYAYAYARYVDRYHPKFSLDWLRKCRTAVEAQQLLDRWGVPSFRTIANRCQELMRADASLKPPRQVQELRQRQRTQGRVR